ncbi:MAG: Na/Pi cotransporter family protein [Rikenellaceae bacterium]|nr:Na/Pi cotransporter family protein [Rikenellaceae bacterium]
MIQVLTLIGALGMFLYGMNLMSAGLQKAAGSKMRSFLTAMTSNPLKGVMTGLGITSVIQSSSATTVMTVGFVNAGLLTLSQAVGVIMGANIGTTVTAWMVSLLGFKADISIFAVPIMAIGFILSLSKRDKRRHISELLVGFSLLFLGLAFMKESVPEMNASTLAFIEGWTSYGFGSVLIFMVFGTLLTLVLQSSSATMALTLVAMNMGYIPFEMAAAMVLGENIGTTITANIAAAVGNANARRAALAHTLFNVFGVCWALALFTPFLGLVGEIITWMGLPNPIDIDSTELINASGESAASLASLYGISMLHTLFNLFNTIILIWFVPVIVKIVTTVIKDKKGAEEDSVKLKFIDAGHLSTAELAIGEARNEVIHFAEVSSREVDFIRRAIKAKNDKEFEEMRQKLVKYEEISDRMEYEIAQFLNALPEDSISEATRTETKRMYKVIGELESLGDSGEAIARILMRRNSHERSFTAEQIAKLDTMLGVLDKCYRVMIDNLKAETIEPIGLRQATDCEIELNELRNTIREEEIHKIESDGSNYTASVYYLDTVSEIERMGDFIINISQALDK